jgi:hypothetical protein
MFVTQLTQDIEDGLDDVFLGNPAGIVMIGTYSVGSPRSTHDEGRRKI